MNTQPLHFRPQDKVVMNRVLVTAIATLMILTLGGVSRAQSATTRVGISGDRFTLNGQQKFLLGVSYYDGNGWKASDLDVIRDKQFNLIRIFMDLETIHPSRTFLNSDGTLRNSANLLSLVRACAARGIVVDVAILDIPFSNQLTNQTPVGTLESAVRNAVQFLGNEPNVIFDISNEHDYGGRGHSHGQCGQWLAAARQQNPNAILFFSCSDEGHVLQSDTVVNASSVNGALAQGIQVYAPHLMRTSDWHAATGTRVTTLRNHLRSVGKSIPIYLQEENRRYGSLGPTANEFVQAATHALAAGAAGWVFHNDKAYDLSGGTTWFGNLDGEERAAVEALGPAVFGGGAPPPTGTFTVTAGPATVSPGSAVTVSWTAPAGQTSALDWVGLHAGTTPPTGPGSIWWRYTNGATSGSFSLTAPTTAGTYTFRYFLNDGYTPMASAPLTVSNAPPPPPPPLPPPPSGQTPYVGTASAIPGTIEAEDFDLGGEGVAYHDGDASNNGGAYRPGEGVDLEAASTGGVNVGWGVPGEWLEYTVSVGAAGTYTLEVGVASSGPGGTFHLEFGGVDLTGPLTVPDTAGWQSWTTITKAGLSLPSGTQVMRLALDAAGPNGWVGNFNFLRFVVANDGGGGDGFNGVFRIIARHSGKALDVSGYSYDNGAPVHQWSYWGGENQHWRIEPLGDGSYRLLAQHSGKALDVSQSSLEDGARVHQWDSWGGANQHWRIEPVGDGYHRLIATHSGKALSIAGESSDDGAEAVQWADLAGGHQHWSLEPVASVASGVDTAGSNGSRCGATGIETLLLAGMLVLLRRRSGRPRFVT